MENYMDKLQEKIEEQFKNSKIKFYQPKIKKLLIEYFNMNATNYNAYITNKNDTLNIINSLLDDYTVIKNSNTKKLQDYMNKINVDCLEFTERYGDMTKSLDYKKYDFDQKIEKDNYEVNQKHDNRIKKNNVIMDEKISKLQLEKSLIENFYKEKIKSIDSKHFDEQELDFFFNKNYFDYNYLLNAEEDNLFYESKTLKSIDDKIVTSFTQKQEVIIKTYNDNIIRNNTLLRKNKNKITAKLKYYNNKFSIESKNLKVSHLERSKKLDLYRIEVASSLTEDLIKFKNDASKFKGITKKRFLFQNAIRKEIENLKKYNELLNGKTKLKFDYLQILEKQFNSKKNNMIEYSISFNKIKKENQSDSLRFKLEFDLATSNINAQISKSRINNFYTLEKNKIESEKNIFLSRYKAYEVLLTLNKQKENSISAYQIKMKNLEIDTLKNNIQEKMEYLMFLKEKSILKNESLKKGNELDFEKRKLEYHNLYSIKEKKTEYQKKLIENNYNNSSVKGKAYSFAKINSHQFLNIKNLVSYHFNNLKELTKIHKIYINFYNTRNFIKNIKDAEKFFISINFFDNLLKEIIKTEYAEFSKSYNIYLTKKIQLLFGKEARINTKSALENYNLKKDRNEADISGIEDNNKTLKNKILRLSYELLLANKNIEDYKKKSIKLFDKNYRILSTQRNKLSKEINDQKIILLENNNKIVDIKKKNISLHKKYKIKIKNIESAKRKNAKLYYNTIDQSKNEIKKLNNFYLSFFYEENNYLVKINNSLHKTAEMNLDSVFKYNHIYNNRYLKLEKRINYSLKKFENYTNNIFSKEKKINITNQKIQDKHFKKNISDIKSELSNYKNLIDVLQKKKKKKLDFLYKTENIKINDILAKNVKEFNKISSNYKNKNALISNLEYDFTLNFISNIELIETNKLQINENYNKIKSKSKTNAEISLNNSYIQYEELKNKKPKNLDYTYLENKFNLESKNASLLKTNNEKMIQKKIKILKNIHRIKFNLLNKKIMRAKNKLKFKNLY